MNRKSAAFVAGLMLSASGVSTVATAESPIGPYAGVAVGTADVRYEYHQIFGATPDFDEHHFGWQVFAGLRPISFAGVELAYTDFGHPSVGQTDFYAATDAKQSATSLFGVGYLPLPVPFLDLYGKVGAARLHTEATLTTLPSQPVRCNVIPGCFPITYHQSESNTDLAYGAGAQAKVGGFVIRAEYERFGTGHTDPDLFSLGLAWLF
jgi:opacity protein-like surface antigen